MRPIPHDCVWVRGGERLPDWVLPEIDGRRLCEYETRSLIEREFTERDVIIVCERVRIGLLDTELSSETEGGTVFEGVVLAWWVNDNGIEVEGEDGLVGEDEFRPKEGVAV